MFAALFKQSCHTYSCHGRYILFVYFSWVCLQTTRNFPLAIDVLSIVYWYELNVNRWDIYIATKKTTYFTIFNIIVCTKNMECIVIVFKFIL